MRRPGWPEIALGAVGYVVVTVLAVLVLAGTATPGTPALAAVAIGVSGVAALGAFALAYGVRVRSLPAFGVRRATGRWLLLGLAGGLLGWLVNRGIILGYVLLSGDTSNPQAAPVPGATGGAVWLAVTLLLGAVLVPVGEELLFRGVITTALGRYGPWVAVLGSALVFALAHGVSIVLPAALVLGVVNAVLLRRSGSVWPGVVAHGVNNALVFGLTAIVL